MTIAATVCTVSLDPDLARRLANAGRKSEEWREKRDELVREAARNGGTLREIAAAVGLSNPGVLRIIRRGGDVQVAHKIPVSKGGTSGPENTVFLTPDEHARHDAGDQ